MSSLNRGTYVILLFAVLFSSHFAYSQVSGPQAVSGEYIVKFKGKSSAMAGNLRAVSKLGSSISIKSIMDKTRMMHVKVNTEAARDALMNNPDVEYIEPNYILSVNPTEVSPLGSAPSPSDEYVQSGADSRVQITDSWQIQKPYNQGSKVIVAVIDTGLDTNHLLFRDSGAIWTNAAEVNGVNGVDDDGNGFVDDKNGWNFAAGSPNVYDDNDHGTHVAGIVMGVGQDVVAYPVRESKVKIMALKFLDGSGSGSTAGAVSAIYYAVQNGAKVINNSWGGASYSQSLHEAYTYAYNQGVVIVSAAGNSNSNNDSVSMYPANLDTPNNISVAASDDNDAKASFSSYGANTVAVAAPGVRILSAVPGTGCFQPGCFQLMSGTSMATPLVAGLAALVFREAPQLSAYQVKSLIMSSVDSRAAWSTRVITGGRVNALKTISAAAAAAATAPWSPSYEPDYKASRSPASETEGVAAPAGCGLVKAIVDSQSGSGGGGLGEAADIFLFFSLLMLPLAVALSLRSYSGEKTPAHNRRVHERYSVAKLAVLQFADQAINVMTDDISTGGLSFSTNVGGLTKGQILDVQFSGSSATVKAEVVWSKQQQAYGLRFIDASNDVKDEISAWTKNLKPSR